MADSNKKRTLDAFFKPPPKKIRVLEDVDGEKQSQSLSIAEEVSFEC
jgi:hypothetical protein